MRLATIPGQTPDGELVVVSQDGARYLGAGNGRTMQWAMENWRQACREVESAQSDLDDVGGESTSDTRFAAPLPRVWQWLDGSAYDTHGDLMQKAFGLDPIETDKPLIYHGMSHVVYGPRMAALATTH